MPRPVAQLLGVRDFYPGHFPARFYPIAFQTACLFQTFDRPECLLITAPKAHKIRILATSDVHMHLMPHDYFADEVRAGTGLEASAAHITALRREAQQNGASCLLFDNGDLLQGNPLADQIARMDWNNTDIHPVAALMNALEYDALGVGNHDLDYGVTYLARFARDLHCPLVSSNLSIPNAEAWLHPSCMLKCGPVHVGVVSVLPKRTEIWGYAKLHGKAVLHCMLSSLTSEVKSLRQSGADVIVALGHTGLGADRDENVLTQIAQSGLVDALIGGHTHVRFPDTCFAGVEGVDLSQGQLHDVPTVMPGYAAAAVGCIDLNLQKNDTDGWKVVKGTGCLIGPEQDALPHQAFGVLKQAHEKTRSELSVEMGHTEHPLNSYFAQVQPTAMLAISASAKIAAVNRARQGTEFADLPLLSATAPERVGGKAGPENFSDIPAGNLTRRQVAEFHIYRNDIWGVPITGAELIAWCDTSARAFSDPESIGTDGLLDPAVPAFDFDVFHGLSYEIDITRPRTSKEDQAAAGRICNITYRGATVRADDKFLVATSNYRACGGGQFPGLSPDRHLFRPVLPSDQVINDFLACGEKPRPLETWRFASTCRGIKTWFKTGPGATKYLSEIANLSPGETNFTEDGFLKVPITL